MAIQKEYDKKQIKTLEGIEAVRKRPDMWIRGGVSKLGWHSLFYEIFSNSVDEFIENQNNKGFLKKGDKFVIKVDLINDTTIIIEDNGRGIPVGMTKDGKGTTIETIFTKLHTGGKFDAGAYEFSGGLHGVGTSLVTFMAHYVKVTVWRDGKEYEIVFKDGIIDGPVKEKKSIRNKRGTKIEFSLNKDYFDYKGGWDTKEIREIIHKHKFLMDGVYIIYNDIYNGKKEIFENNNGLKEYIEEYNKENVPVISVISGLTDKKEIISEGKIEKIIVDYAFQITNDQIYHGIEGYGNNIYTSEGGFHCKGLEKAILKGIKNVLKAEKFNKITSLTNDDILKGLKGIVSVKLTNPRFEGQAKGKLNNEWVEKAIQDLVSNEIENKLKKTEITKLKQYYSDIIDIRTKTDDVIRKIIKKNVSEKDRVKLIGNKLKDANSNKRELCELYIVEGDSAGGGLLQVRDTDYIGVLPLKGKPKNIENKIGDAIEKNRELQALIYALGCGIGKDFDIRKLRYGKIIILADGDEDGRHITALMLGFFYKVFPQLIREGKIYEGKAPAYKIIHKKKTYYVYNDAEKEKLLKTFTTKPDDINRLKGLGEMKPIELYETCVINRKHVQIRNTDDEKNGEIISNVLGNNPVFRLELFQRAVADMIGEE